MYKINLCARFAFEFLDELLVVRCLPRHYSWYQVQKPLKKLVIIAFTSFTLVDFYFLEFLAIMRLFLVTVIIFLASFLLLFAPPSSVPSPLPFLLWFKP